MLFSGKCASKLIKVALIVCLTLLSLQLPPAKSYAYSHTGGMYTQAQINFVKAKVAANAQPWKMGYDKMIADANAWSGEAPSAPVVWHVPGFYDDANGHNASIKTMMDDAKAAYANAMAYQFTGASSYANTARNIINNWAYTNTAITGPDGDLVGAYVGVGLILSAELINNYPGWSASDKNQFKSWLTSVYLPVVNIGGNNNAGTWSSFARLCAFHFLDDTAGFAGTVSRLKSQINIQVASDGHLPDETWRGRNSMWYTYFALAPMTAASQVVYNVTGENLFTGKVQTALDYFFTYAQNPEEWPWDPNPYFPNPFVSESWGANLYEAMGGIYGNADYTNLVQAYRPLNGPFNSGKYHHFAWFYPTLMYQALVLDGGSPPSSPVTYEAESLTVNAISVSHTISNNDKASGGKYDLLNAYAVNDFIEYKVNVPQAGRYKVKVRVMKYGNNGAYQLKINGSNQGAVFDTYQTTGHYADYSLGSVTLGSAGDQLFRFVTSGKNASSSGYKLPLDFIVLEKE